jgi:L-lysine exporter family protein LysE/ArgO
MFLRAIFEGFIFGAGLIIAIGAQNAFVLRQGLTRNHVFATALICTLSDMVLIALGVGGLGTVIASSQVLTSIAAWGGGLFLLYYGARSFISARKSQGINSLEKSVSPDTLRKTIAAALGFSLLNPHVYIDTVVLIGSLGAQYPVDTRWGFAGGAMLASLSWFFGLAYGAARLTPIFEKPLAAKLLDILIGVIMWMIAFSLLKEPVTAIIFSGR